MDRPERLISFSTAHQHGHSHMSDLRRALQSEICDAVAWLYKCSLRRLQRLIVNVKLQLDHCLLWDTRA